MSDFLWAVLAVGGSVGMAILVGAIIELMVSGWFDDKQRGKEDERV
jgi:hypothetical protein